MHLVVAILLLALGSVAAEAQVLAGDDAPLRFGRFEAEGKAHYGFLAAGGIHQLSGSFFDPETTTTGRVFQPDDVKMLAPVVPGKVIGIALNYASHGGVAGDMGFFAKLPSAVIGPDGAIVPPPGSSDLHYEGEMVIVMGLAARNVPEAEALGHVFGVTAGNDVTERGFGAGAFTVLKAKGADTMAPMGPWIVPGLAYDSLKWETRVNGKTVQKASTKQMIRSTAAIVAELSRYMTLEPGDAIFTGTAGKTGALKAGDVVEISLEGVGTLRNTVEAAR